MDGPAARHAVLGAGGIGGLMAISLARTGVPVTLVLKSNAVDGYPDVLELETPSGTFRVPVTHAASVPAVDVVWLAVKAHQLDSALGTLRAAASSSKIVPLLNGVDHLTVLRSAFGSDRVIAATIAVEAERIAPGHFAQRTPFVRLNVSARGRDTLAACLGRLRALDFNCQFVENEPSLMWSKLVFLAPFALATTAYGKTKGQIRQNQTLSAQLDRAVLETCATARAEGAVVDPEQVLSFIDSLPEATRSSMQKDVERGQLPELDAIGGAVVRAAERHALDVPVTRELMNIIRQKVTGVG